MEKILTFGLICPFWDLVPQSEYSKRSYYLSFPAANNPLWYAKCRPWNAAGLA